MVKKTTWLFTLIFASLVLLAGCYGGEKVEETDKTDDPPGETKEEEKVEKSVLHLAVAGEIPTLKSNGAMDGLSQTMIQNIFEGLFRVDANDKIIEGIVDTYDVSEDGKQYTFHLRQDAVWSNGDPTTAQDFIYSWKKALHPESISPHAYLMGAVKGAANIQDPDHEMYGKVDELGVTAPDEFTLVVEMENTVPYFTELLAHPVFIRKMKSFRKSKKTNTHLNLKI